ncbi:MAG TPA: fused MFS/spermidine synthase [Candidatus Hydrogenedentes bacterium]|nr:fused MFS/spermidine synthase [Candidatus Hydrogenedentota bacterium]
MSLPEKRSNTTPLLVCAIATVFLSNAAIMVVELVAGRLVSRYLGQSLYTWTAIIGVILAGMSLGNYLGGRMADRMRPLRTLAGLFLLAAASCVVILPLNFANGNWPLLIHLSWPLRIALHTTFVFLLPAAVLGAISPVVVKAALPWGRGPGRSVGAVFAAGAAGSIAGTFLAGFWLIFTLSASHILLLSAAVMLLLALSYGAVTLRYPENRPMLPLTPDDPLRPRGISWLGPYITVFVSNAAFMTLELAASRVLAREFGASLYTWTTIIGVVLAGVTLGNYFGGRIADWKASRATVATIFLLSSLFTLLSPAVSRLTSDYIRETYFMQTISWPMQITIFTSVIFFLPCLCIGGISPIVVRRTLDEGIAPGRAVGAIYAWGALGGISATFLSGYALIDWMGATSLIIAMAFLLAIPVWAYAPRRFYATGWILVCASALLVSMTYHPKAPRVVYEDESQYSYIAVTVDPMHPQLREMILDKLTHSMVNMDDPKALQYEYEWVYEAVIDKFFPNAQPLRSLVIGGGGYAFPHYLEMARPGGYTEVAEIDPAVTEAAHAAFGLPRNTALAIYNMDARNRVEDILRQPNPQKFDCIFGDSINDYTVPYHLTTMEFTRGVHTLLQENGIYMLNMIDMYSSGAFLAAVISTCQQVFPYVYAFNTGRPAIIRDTFIVVCSKHSLNLSDISERIKSKHKYVGVLLLPQMVDELLARQGRVLLTDDYAPVENLLAPVVRSRKIDRGELHFSRAQHRFADGDWEGARSECQKALEIHPEWPDVFELLGDIMHKREDLEKAEEWYRKSLPTHRKPGPAHFKLGKLLLEENRLPEAIPELRAAVDNDPPLFKEFVQIATDAMNAGNIELGLPAWEQIVQIQPGSATNHYNLGVALAAKQRFPEAIDQWKAALAITPNHENSLQNLALAYTITKDYAAAWDAVKKLREYGFTPDPTLLKNLQDLSPEIMGQTAK